MQIYSSIVSFVGGTEWSWCHFRVNSWRGQTLKALEDPEEILTDIHKHNIPENRSDNYRTA